MLPVVTSPRLSGVPVLRLDATGSEFSRWRRSIKFALETKGTWAYCNGACPMPMPAPNPSSSTTNNNKSNDVQPGLLEERRAWVRQDREVKLDVFLSLAEEVMDEVFEVGPPLPPSNCNAQEMMKALDEHFEAFSFEGYHHAFCHFLNLHIDQYATIEDFNKEFSTVLEDLLDYGHPLSNTQACSAYFSKLRCTQNPWVAKKLEELDAQAREPEIYDLMQESPPWSCIKPLATKSSQIFHLSHREPTAEEYREGSSVHSNSNVLPQLSHASTMSSSFSHSKQTSIDSQEITVQPKPRIAGVDPRALCEALEALPKLYIPIGTESATPNWLNAKTSVAPILLSPPPTRPLPALPSQTLQTPTIEPRPRSASPHLLFKTKSQPNFSRPRTADPSLTPSSHLQVEPACLTLRPRTPTFPPPPLSNHPAFRPLSLDPPLPNDLHRPTPPIKSPRRTIRPSQHEDTTPDDTSSIYSTSAKSSILSLPLQGTHKDDGKYEHPRTPPPLPPSTTRLPTLSPTAQATALPNSPRLPPLTLFPPISLTPTTPDTILPSPPPPPPSTTLKTSPISPIQKTRISQSHRLSGDSLLESSSETREREQARLKRRRAKGWSIGVNIARFTHSKGVKEII